MACSAAGHQLFLNVNIVRLRNRSRKRILGCHQSFWSAVVRVTVHVTFILLSYLKKKQNGDE